MSALHPIAPASQEELAQLQRVCIERRLEQLAAAESLQNLDREAVFFVEDMRRRAQQVDRNGLQGGLLLTLTDPQSRFLTSLANRAVLATRSQPEAAPRQAERARQ